MAVSESKKFLSLHFLDSFQIKEQYPQQNRNNLNKIMRKDMDITSMMSIHSKE